MKGVSLVCLLYLGLNIRGPSGVIIGPMTNSSRGMMSSPVEPVDIAPSLQVNPATAITPPTKTTQASRFFPDQAKGTQGDSETDIGRFPVEPISYRACLC